MWLGTTWRLPQRRRFLLHKEGAQSATPGSFAVVCLWTEAGRHRRQLSNQCVRSCHAVAAGLLTSGQLRCRFQGHQLNSVESVGLNLAAVRVLSQGPAAVLRALQARTAARCREASEMEHLERQAEATLLGLVGHADGGLAGTDRWLPERYVPRAASSRGTRHPRCVNPPASEVVSHNAVISSFEKGGLADKIRESKVPALVVFVPKQGCMRVYTPLSVCVHICWIKKNIYIYVYIYIYVCIYVGQHSGYVRGPGRSSAESFAWSMLPHVAACLAWGPCLWVPL